MKQLFLILSLSVFMFSTSYSQEKTFITEFFLDFTGPSQKTINLNSGSYIFEVSGTFCLSSCSNGDTRDVRYYFNDPQQSGIILVEDHNAFTINEYCPQYTTGCNLLSPIETNYQEDHVYNYNVSFKESGDQTIYGVADECCWGDNQGGLTFKVYSTGEDILLNGTISAESNQIRNVADPTDAQDAATKAYIDALITSLQSQIDALQPTSVTDIDGNTYDILTYGDQVWTVENAEMVTYRDGTEIPQVTDNTVWEALTTGAWAYYNNDPTKPRLYNWYAVMGIHDNDENTPNKAFAPEGWHVPTDAEWTELENYLIANGYNYDGTTTGNKIAKAMASTTGWLGSTNQGATGNDQSLNNSSGFNAFPEGYRNINGSFFDVGYVAICWSSTEFNTSDAWDRYLINDYSNLLRNDNGKQYGFSVRFVRD